MRRTLYGTYLIASTCLLVSAGTIAQTSVDWNDRRITALESQSLDARLRVLEESMSEIKWTQRAVATVVIGQLTLAGVASLRRKATP